VPCEAPVASMEVRSAGRTSRVIPWRRDRIVSIWTFTCDATNTRLLITTNYVRRCYERFFHVEPYPDYRSNFARVWMRTQGS
jgi:hypothetical protein